jgi:diguanylate cyclase (GGDEF)-like protein
MTLARRPLVLVVDDDPGARLLQSAALEAGGFAIQTAANGAAALEAFKNTPPDCMVLDVVMPGINGYEVCAEIRRLPQGRHAPILILTSLDDRDSISLAYAAGASDFAQKGLAPLLLVERVRFLLRAHELQKHLSDSEARLAEAQRIARMGHWEVDLDGRTVSVSPVALEMLDLTADAAPDFAALAKRICAPDQERFAEAVASATRNDSRFGIDASAITRQGNRILHLEGQLSDRNAVGLERSLVITVQDITELRRAEERARLLEYFDTVTGLPNKAYLQDRLSQRLNDAGADSQIAVIVLDIEHLNRVNDSLGSHAGDQLLIQIGRRLTQCLAELQKQRGVGDGPPSTVARIGGDEFGIELRLNRQSDVLPEVLNTLQAKLREPFDVSGHEIIVAATMGVAAWPDDASDAESLLRFADAALHQAKQTIRGGCQFYSANLQSRAAIRLSLESDLRRALERNQLQLHYQPRIALATNTPTGVEALLRWHHPQRGWVSPGEFIPIAEELGLIIDIGAWVLQEGLRQAAAWAAAGTRLSVAVNVSALQFQRASVATQVAEALRASGASAQFLELEITEGILIDRPQLVRETLQGLRGSGIRIALDDFGTGYSSLTYLRRLPIDCLKIDRSFINDLSEPDGPRLVSGIIALAHHLGLGIVAEGVETKAQLQFLRENGCEEVQGFLLAKPMPAEAIESWLVKWFQQDASTPRMTDSDSRDRKQSA